MGGKVLVKLMVWVVIYWVAGDAIRKMGLCQKCIDTLYLFC